MTEPGEILMTAGQMLRQAREARGLSLLELAAITRIGPEHLTALEEDSAEELLEPLYVRSFLRTAAAALGLSAEEVLLLYDRSRGQAPSGPPVWEEEKVTIRRVGGSMGRWLRWVGLAVAAAAVVFVAVRTLDRAGAGWLRRPAPAANGLGPGPGAADFGAVVTDTVTPARFDTSAAAGAAGLDTVPAPEDSADVGIR